MYKIAELQNIEVYECIMRCKLTMLYHDIHTQSTSFYNDVLIRVNDVVTF